MLSKNKSLTEHIMTLFLKQVFYLHIIICFNKICDK